MVSSTRPSTISTTLSPVSTFVSSATSRATSSTAPPASSSTAPAPAKIPVGVAITGCTVPGTIALTFDDGPHIYTPKILNLLQDANVKASFFVNGQNFANINDPANQDSVRRIVNEGHLLASHTWNHPDMARLGKADIVSQFQRLEDALFSIVGKYSTYFRAPYFSYSDLVMQTAAERGYKVVNANIDTKDYENLNNMQVGIQNFKNGLNAGGSIVLAHDVHQATADTLVAGMLAEIKARGLKGVTVTECLGDPVANWYRTR
ncbi:MAG: hypothetical protein Q9221_004211 [Calogaya cf. arnoldii]